MRRQPPRRRRAPPTLLAASDSGVKGDRITNITRPTFTGTAVAGAKVTILSNGIAVGSATAATNGAYSVAVITPLANGVHTITATATVGTVTSAQSAKVYVTIDTTIPATPGTPTLSQMFSNVASIKGTTDSDTTVSLYANGVLVGRGMDYRGTYIISTTPLTNGTHSIVAVATDAAGNVSHPSAAFSLVVNVVQPSVPSVPVLESFSDSGVKGDRITNATKPTFMGTATAGSLVKIYSGTTLLGSGWAIAGGLYAVTITVSLANGVHPITALATNSAGTSAASAATSVTIQTILPAAPSTPAIVSTATLTPTFTGSAPAGGTVTIYADNVAVGTGVATSGGAYSITVRTLATGAHFDLRHRHRCCRKYLG